MTHKIRMCTSSKQPPARHNKYHFLKVNIKDYYHANFQVYIIFSFRKNRGGTGTFTPHSSGRMTPHQASRLNRVNIRSVTELSFYLIIVFSVNLRTVLKRNENVEGKNNFRSLNLDQRDSN